MSREAADLLGGLILLAVMLFFAFAIWRTGYLDGEKACKLEAVRRGAAEWVTDEAGNPQWQWKDGT